MKINIQKTLKGNFQLTFSPRDNVTISFIVKPDEKIESIYSEFVSKFNQLKKGK